MRRVGQLIDAKRFFTHQVFAGFDGGAVDLAVQVMRHGHIHRATSELASNSR